jgi:predicted dehydrogenase
VAKIRVGIVGVGRHGTRYARHASKDVEGLELAAVCRRDVEAGGALAEELGCDFEADALRLVERKDIDAVILVTVPWILEDLATAAIASGKRLLIEKPIALDLEMGARIAQQIDSYDAFCMAGQTLRFNTIANAIRDRLPDLGRLDSMIFSQRFPPQLQLDWLDDPTRSGGGSILHTGVHCFDLIRYISGLEPESVSCSMRSIYTKRTEDSFVSELTLRDHSALAMVSCSRTTESRNGLIELTGEHGQLVGDHVANTLYRVTADGAASIETAGPRHTVLEALRAFAADIQTGAAPRIGYSDGLAAVATASACYRSAASSRREHVVMP